MYKYKAGNRNPIKSCEKVEGERLETKIERIMSNKEPIKDGAPIIYTERKDGVPAAYNIRTDRWEIAAEAMDKIEKSITAKREEKAKEGFAKAEEEARKAEGKAPEGDAGKAEG